MTPFDFGRVDQLVLIGGGDTMVHAARFARKLGMAVSAVLSHRHAAEVLTSGETLEEVCRREVDVTEVVEDVNRAWLGPRESGPRSLALCFGPAWIFSPEVRSRFTAGMINYNPIPVPRYLGGAHYTWQIMNGDRRGGCVLQLITDEVDRGPILAECSFEIDTSARYPADYSREYHKHGVRLVEDFLGSVSSRKQIIAQPFECTGHRLYLPRLHTPSNAFIDWRWSGDQIERFCCAFDAPFMGAGTFIRGSEVRFHDVWFEPGEIFHPYLSGLIISREGDHIRVATSGGGCLRLGKLQWPNAPVAFPREGDRFYTPSEFLERAATFRPKYTGKGLANRNKP